MCPAVMCVTASTLGQWVHVVDLFVVQILSSLCPLLPPEPRLKVPTLRKRIVPLDSCWPGVNTRHATMR